MVALAVCCYHRGRHHAIGVVSYSQLGDVVALQLEVELAGAGFGFVLLLHQFAMRRMGMA